MGREQATRRTGPIRVVIADDHAIVREPLCAWLETEESDFVVVGEAANGAQAIRLVEAHRPEILLLDVLMPGVDGVQVARILSKAVPDTRIVVLTGYPDARQARVLVDLGVAGYFPKETPLDELVAALRAVNTGQTCLARCAAQALCTQAAQERAPTLTVREREVLLLVATDRRNAEIAADLCVCIKTVQSHISSTLQKLGVHSRGAAVLKARELGLI